MPLPVPPHVSLVCVLLPVLPWPDVVFVSVNLSFFPVVVVVQVFTPFTLVNVPPDISHALWLGEAANAGTARATTNKAATANIISFLIIFLLCFSASTYPSLGTYKDVFTPTSQDSRMPTSGAGLTCVGLRKAKPSVRPLLGT